MRVAAEIDLNALKHNLGIVRTLAPKTKVLAMVKANAYGHGLVLCANNIDADFLGIASLVEARRLRDAGITKRIVFMPGIQHQHDFDVMRELDLDTIIYDMRQLKLLASNKTPDRIRAWLKVDTGMHRLGCALSDTENFLQHLESLAHVEIVCVMSHLACADKKNSTQALTQLEAFDRLSRNWAYPRSLLNSAGIINFPEHQYEIVRPGLMLYGASPIDHMTINQIGLQPVMEISASIFALDDVNPGESVGYGASWVAPKKSRIATISVGYGDGYPQVANEASVMIQGQACPVVGRVSMDFTAVDVSALPNVELGDRVLLWGRTFPANKVAEQMQVTVYRLLTGVMERVPRKIRHT